MVLNAVTIGLPSVGYVQEKSTRNGHPLATIVMTVQ
jgi:hypothetical protein